MEVNNGHFFFVRSFVSVLDVCCVDESRSVRNGMSADWFYWFFFLFFVYRFEPFFHFFLFACFVSSCVKAYIVLYVRLCVLKCDTDFRPMNTREYLLLTEYTYRHTHGYTTIGPNGTNCSDSSTLKSIILILYRYTQSHTHPYTASDPIDTKTKRASYT